MLEKDKEMELSNESRLSDLPEHYIEVSRLLLENCEDDIEDASEVRSTIDAIIKVRENCLNEFRGRVIDYVSSAVQQNRNQGIYDEFVRRPFYNVLFRVAMWSQIIEGVSSFEAHHLFSHFLPVLEELNKLEDLRRQVLSRPFSVFHKHSVND